MHPLGPFTTWNFPTINNTATCSRSINARHPNARGGQRRSRSTPVLVSPHTLLLIFTARRGAHNRAREHLQRYKLPLLPLYMHGLTHIYRPLLYSSSYTHTHPHTTSGSQAAPGISTDARRACTPKASARGERAHLITFANCATIARGLKFQ